MRRLLTALVLAVAGMVSMAIPASASPSAGQPCNDLGKLDYAPGMGQIACDGSSWVHAVEPTGIRNLGAPCARSEWDSVMAATPDGYLVWCPLPAHVWTVFSQ
jgi:hypothetical protein